MFGRSSQIGVIAYEYWDIEVDELGLDELTHRDVPPAQGRRHVKVPILGPNEARHRDADGHDPWPVLESRQERPDETFQVLHDLLGPGAAERNVAPSRGDDLAAQTHHRSPDPVSGEVYGKGARTVLAQLHDRRRTSRRLWYGRRSTTLPYDAAGNQIRYQGRDGASIHAKPRRQFGPRQGPADVQFPQHPAEVAAPYLSLGAFDFASNTHRVAFPSLDHTRQRSRPSRRAETDRFVKRTTKQP
jgi:hypothetical protein